MLTLHLNSLRRKRHVPYRRLFCRRHSNPEKVPGGRARRALAIRFLGRPPPGPADFASRLIVASAEGCMATPHPAPRDGRARGRRVPAP